MVSCLHVILHAGGGPAGTQDPWRVSTQLHFSLIPTPTCVSHDVGRILT
jgi:hypothetical protein